METEGFAIVGDGGPDLVTLPSGANVVPTEKKTMRIRVQNDGSSAWHTKIIDDETGRELQYVTGLNWTVDLNDPALRDGIMTLTVMMPIVNTIVDAEIKHVCPCCGRDDKPPIRGTYDTATTLLCNSSAIEVSE